jgi:endonuclease/exonuclease/phosphatase family metal-dependent hydrolase
MKTILILLAFTLGSLTMNAADNPHDTLRVATFNIRYDNPDDGINTWALRKDSVAGFLNKQELAIFGLQEVLYNQLQDLKKALPEYDALGSGRDNGLTKGEYSPVFYNKHRFSALKWGVFWLSSTPEKPGSKGWDAACSRIATWVKFKENTSGKIFYFVATHFDNEGVIARKNSAVLIQNELKKIAGENSSIILAGDFNSTPTDIAYKTMTDPVSGFVDSKSVAQKISGEAWSFHDFGQMPLAERPLIDFIFIKGSFTVLSYKIPFIEHNGHYLSDHNPVLVELVF